MANRLIYILLLVPVSTNLLGCSRTVELKDPQPAPPITKKLPPAPPGLLDQDALNTITICSGGTDVGEKLTIDLIAELRKHAAGQLSAEAGQAFYVRASNDGIFADRALYTIYLQCVDTNYRKAKYLALPPHNPLDNNHRAETIAEKVGDGIYVTKKHLQAGTCILDAGATIQFKDNGTASFSAKVSTTPSGNGIVQAFQRDYFHSYWAIADSNGYEYMLAGDFTSDVLLPNAPKKDYSGIFRYTGPKPDAPYIEWVGDC